MRRLLMSSPALLALLWLSVSSNAAEQVADVVVSVDGEGDFKSIQAAIMSAPYRGAGLPWTIQVQPGVYDERVYVQRERGNIRLVGVDASKCILTGKIHAHMRGADGKPLGTFRTQTMQIDGDRFEIENLTIENSAGPVGQALALRTDGDRLVFRKCRFLGWQDTVFLNRGRAYFEDCYIEGHVDFIFGGATVWFERCHIHCLRKGYITAASTPPCQEFGFVFHKCRITSDEGVQTYLGRPWRDYAMTTFLECEMDEGVRTEGWHNWGHPSREKTVRYAEYNTTGPGANNEGRVNWASQLDERQASQFTVAKVLAGDDAWKPGAKARSGE